MGTIRRYGPSMVAPEVTPAPDLGRASVQVFETIEKGFTAVNDFLKPAVTQIQQAKGEQEAMAALDQGGPDFRLERKVPLTEAPQMVGPDGKPLPEGSPGPGVAAKDGAPLVGGQGDRRAPAGKKVKSAWDWRRSATAIRSVESQGSGDYAALGPVLDNGDRAYGAYQVMGANIPAWTKKWFGKELTPAEFLANTRAQDMVFRGEFGSYVEKYGNEQDAASMWFSGRPLAEAGNASDGYLETPQYVAKFSEALGSTGPGGGMADYEIRNVNANTFEPRIPFTVRDAAFNATADRVIAARAAEALESGMQIAQAKANGDVNVLRSEMEKLRGKIMSSLPKELPGLATDLEAQYARGLGVAERNAIDLKQRQMIVATGEALKAQASSVQAEVERLALTGGSSAQISAALAQGQDALAVYGPREEFTINGKTYGADPQRAGIMTPSEIATGVAALGQSSHKIMIESEFMRSAAPGQFVEEFRKQVFAGKSPLPVGESLQLLSELQGRANAAESARRTEANAERTRLEKEYKDRINPYVEMTEGGVPVAIPAQERQRILTSLAPYPDLQRQASVEFAVADAAVATHGMRGDELVAYAETVKADIAAAAERGDIDLESVGVLTSLEDRLKKVQDAVNAEMIGLPMIEQLAMDGATADDIDWEALRTQAAGKPDVLDQINVVEAFYRDIEKLDGMTAQERDEALAEARRLQAETAAKGKDYGAAAQLTTQVIGKLEDWSKKRADLAANDAMTFAKAVGVALPSMEGAQTVADVGKVLAQRVALLAPHTASEGVKNPVPLSPREIDAISEVYKNSSRAQQTEFLATVSDLGTDQAQAIFAKIGQSEPTLFAAGAVYAGGNTAAASVILRGAVDTKLAGGTAADISTARATVLGTMLETDMIDPGSIASIDAAALAYARGKAMADGGRDIDASDLERGFEIAMGAQEDGTGGIQETPFGTTVLPAGWDSDRLTDAMRGLDDARLEEIAGGTIQDASTGRYTADELRRTIEQLRVDPEDPNILIPMDAGGGVFLVEKNGQRDILRLDLRNLE